MKQYFTKFKKMGLKILILILCLGASFAVMQIVGCQDVNYLGSTFSGEDCPEIDVEGYDCEYVDEPDGYVETNDPDRGASTSTAGGSPGVSPKTGNRGTSRKRIPKSTINTTLGRIDILFVVDDSGSMAEELESIANQFNDFLSTISEVNYHIAMTTMDFYGNGGQLLNFGNGQNFLSNPAGDSAVHSQNVNYFNQAIQRLKSNADSENSDEGGIFAVNMAVDNLQNYASSANQHSGFFRPHSLFMVIFVSDEDERSFGGQVPEGFVDYEGLVKPLDEYDRPETFFRKVSEQHPFSIVAVHSIITPPGDSSCPSCLTSDCGKMRVEGRVYASASKPSQHILSRYGNIRTGHIGSICSTNYSSQLGPIADTLVQVPPFPLPCVPKAGGLKVIVEGKEVNIRLENRKVHIEEKVSFGAQATIQFYCQSGQQV